MNSSCAVHTAFARDDDLRLGWAPLDAMHEEFLALVRELLNATDADVPYALRAVDHHLRVHFSEEERWMAETGFPATRCHADEHAAVLATMSAIGRKVAARDNDAARLFARALTEWFPPHSQHLDSALAHWICSKRFGGKPVVVRPPVAAAPSVTVTQS